MLILWMLWKVKSSHCYLLLRSVYVVYSSTMFLRLHPKVKTYLVFVKIVRLCSKLTHCLQVSEILCRDEIIVKSEEQVFEAVQRWVSFEDPGIEVTREERQLACPLLLKHVRLPQLSPEYIMSKVRVY